MKTILVTGGAGYIGSHAVKMLLKEGYRVIVVDNLSTGHRSAIDPAAKFYQTSTHNEETLSALLEKEAVDAVMHFAAFSLVGESVRVPLKYYQNNVEGTRALLNAMIKSNVNTLIFSSTAAVYGVQEHMPITEASPLNPVNPYGKTKYMIEQMLEDVSGAYTDFNYASLRYFNVAGAYYDGTIGEKHEPETHLIPNVIKSVLNPQHPLKVFGTDYPTKDGTAIRDYIHVEDLIDAHIKALQYIDQTQSSLVVNLGSSDGYSVLDIIKTTENVLQTSVNYQNHPRRQGDPAVLIASNQKAFQVLQWQPKKSLRDMILSASHYFQSN